MVFSHATRVTRVLGVCLRVLCEAGLGEQLGLGPHCLGVGGGAGVTRRAPLPSFQPSVPVTVTGPYISSSHERLGLSRILGAHGYYS